MVKGQSLGEFDNKVREWARMYPEAAKEGLEEAAKVVADQARINLSGRVLKVRSGDLRRSIGTKVSLKPLKAEIGPFDGSGLQWAKASAHEMGPTTIRAKRDGYLQFQIDGQWKKVKQVTIPQRQFLRPALEAKRSQIDDIILRAIMRGVFRGR